jgi:hypothetical protein
MRIKALVLILGILHCVTINAQEDKNISVSVQISFDTIVLEEQFEVKYTLKNSKVLSPFETPDFKGFNLVAGPMTSQTTSIINGDMSQSVTYTFLLICNHLGTYYIPSASIETEQGTLNTDELEVTVVDKLKTPREQNPSNAYLSPFQDDSFFNAPFFDRGMNPGKSMDDMMKEFDKKFNIEPLFEDKYEIKPKTPDQSPSKKKKEKVYKI